MNSVFVVMCVFEPPEWSRVVVEPYRSDVTVVGSSPIFDKEGYL